MNQLTLSMVAKAMAASHIGDDATFSTVSTDSRSLTKGALFIALSGPNFDGHDHLKEAEQKGACAVMVSREVDCDLPQIKVEDTRIGLGRLANIWRREFPVSLLAITGSNGKTTTKEMLAAILGQKGDVLATEGNLNNDVGLPISLLRLQSERFAVLEMGANHSGEIAWLCEIAQPYVAVITNAGPAHLEGFKDLQGVAEAKGEILSGLSKDGIAVLNADDPQLELWLALAGSRRVVTFGIKKGADVSIDPKAITTLWDQSSFKSSCQVKALGQVFDIELRLAGQHNLMNALAAIAAAISVGATSGEIKRGLASIEVVKGRLQTLTGISGCRLIDDSYNANPASVRAAVDVLATAPGRTWLILGDLAELGIDTEDELHALGEYTSGKGIERFWSVGQTSKFATDYFAGEGQHFEQQADLIETLKSELTADDTVLIKGSRSAAMERVVDALAAEDRD
ncbi:MAG: UDP-N-acetylmuramoyl-tripeptide--D-alanyl-D-alanine ligase [Candidatus Polarisedimenticolaceae bacterium]|nr:UDP-N-acetylmuramoyl-tripeptide--D-alanyl-D-alanine ligase [Candidatus Polarisedimenticolaceae bacterium]